MPKTIELSHRTIVFTVLFLVLVWFLAQITPIIIGLFIAILLMTALNPAVNRLTRAGIPRPVAILVVYILLIGIVVFGLAWIIPPFIDEATRLVNRFPSLVDQAGGWFSSLGISGIDKSIIESQVSQIGRIPFDIVRFTVSFFSNIIVVFSVLIITFYLLAERRNLDRYLLVLFGDDGEKRAKRFVDHLEVRLGGWVRGEITLMSIIGVLTYIGLRLLGIPYALPLAIFAGILEVVPNIGPVISAVPGVVIALTISPVMGLATAALYFLVQQLENSLIVPKVMQKATGVNPLITILSLAIGFQLAGPLGAILAVPIVIVVHVFATEFLFSKSPR